MTFKFIATNICGVISMYYTLYFICTLKTKYIYYYVIVCFFLSNNVVET